MACFEARPAGDHKQGKAELEGMVGAPRLLHGTPIGAFGGDGAALDPLPDRLVLASENQRIMVVQVCQSTIAI